MRKQAIQTKSQMDEQRRQARTKGVAYTSWRPLEKSEYVPYLGRKLSRLAENIERHIARHRCQE